MGFTWQDKSDIVGNFVSCFEGDDVPAESTLLQDYIALWVTSGNAIEVTGGDFGAYMRRPVQTDDPE